MLYFSLFYFSLFTVNHVNTKPHSSNLARRVGCSSYKHSLLTAVALVAFSLF